jgi:hypothetical protein
MPLDNLIFASNLRIAGRVGSNPVMVKLMFPSVRNFTHFVVQGMVPRMCFYNFKASYIYEIAHFLYQLNAMQHCIIHQYYCSSLHNTTRWNTVGKQFLVIYALFDLDNRIIPFTYKFLFITDHSRQRTNNAHSEMHVCNFLMDCITCFWLCKFVFPWTTWLVWAQLYAIIESDEINHKKTSVLLIIYLL